MHVFPTFTAACRFDVEQLCLAHIDLECVFGSLRLAVFRVDPGNGLDVAERENQHRIRPRRLNNVDHALEGEQVR